MAISKPFSSSEDKKTYVFPENQKEDFVSRVVETRADCFQWYDTWFIQELFNKDFATQWDFDLVADMLLDVWIEYYFDQHDTTSNPLYIDETTWTIKSMIDGFVWNFNEYKDKSLEHANELADAVVSDMLQSTKKKESQKTLKKIISRIPDCVVDESRKKQAAVYFATQNPDTTNMFIAPDLFATQCDFATVQEQAVISHVILSEFQKLAFLIEATKWGIRDAIDPKEIDAEHFNRIHKLHKMVLNWKKSAYEKLQTKIMNRVYAHYLATCLIISQADKTRS